MNKQKIVDAYRIILHVVIYIHFLSKQHFSLVFQKLTWLRKCSCPCLNPQRPARQFSFRVVNFATALTNTIVKINSRNYFSTAICMPFNGKESHLHYLMHGYKPVTVFNDCESLVQILQLQFNCKSLQYNMSSHFREFLGGLKLTGV